jgi:hypothetical protein
MYRNEYHQGIPNPGSFTAFRAGCTCDMLLNQFGVGSDMSGGSRHWILADGCPIHNEEVERMWDKMQKEAS